MPAVRVGVVGYGVTGKRVTDAFAAQPDMERVGVSDVSADHRVSVAASRVYRPFAFDSQALGCMNASGLSTAGVQADMLDQCVVVVDCEPKGVGASNKPAHARDAGRPRGDRWEVAIWEDIVTPVGARSCSATRWTINPLWCRRLLARFGR